MPIYEYQCQNCHHELEKLQKISDPPLLACPSCHQDALRKKISAAGFRLKGSGWYETDFKKDKRRNVAGDPGGSSGGDGKAAGADAKTSSDGTKDKPAAAKSSTDTGAKSS